MRNLRPNSESRHPMMFFKIPGSQETQENLPSIPVFSDIRATFVFLPSHNRLDYSNQQGCWADRVADNYIIVRPKLRRNVTVTSPALFLFFRTVARVILVFDFTAAFLPQGHKLYVCFYTLEMDLLMRDSWLHSYSRCLRRVLAPSSSSCWQCGSIHCCRSRSRENP